MADRGSATLLLLETCRAADARYNFLVHLPRRQPTMGFTNPHVPPRLQIATIDHPYFPFLLHFPLAHTLCEALHHCRGRSLEQRQLREAVVGIRRGQRTSCVLGWV
ncbi:hypothetical protein AMTR_s00028p00174660 [Amborella trichopoda]|uniref:Uncharacterized protein n=1 Tax=Amborella trichopoda TaxID=13333 RepID=W1PTK2_AMBTC|nr:hypothetical protein AMTR_s00028p00174660 [Amborella trichopoda]